MVKKTHSRTYDNSESDSPNNSRTKNSKNVEATKCRKTTNSITAAKPVILEESGNILYYH
jgi:hypothetical protein